MQKSIIKYFRKCGTSKKFFGDIIARDCSIIPILFQQGGVGKMSCITPFPVNCHINPICIEDFIVLKTKLDNVLVVLNVGEIKDINLIEQVGFDGFWNNNVLF
jgi:hypothetical protein